MLRIGDGADYRTEMELLVQDIEDLAECAGVDVSGDVPPGKACALVLSEMKRRLMPVGCEWPRFDDGTPVRFGGLAMVRDRSGEVASVTVSDGWWGVTVGCHGGGTVTHGHLQGRGGPAPGEDGERVRRYVPDTWEFLLRDARDPSRALSAVELRDRAESIAARGGR